MKAFFLHQQNECLLRLLQYLQQPYCNPTVPSMFPQCLRVMSMHHLSRRVEHIALEEADVEQ